MSLFENNENNENTENNELSEVDQEQNEQILDLSKQLQPILEALSKLNGQTINEYVQSLINDLKANYDQKIKDIDEQLYIITELENDGATSIAEDVAKLKQVIADFKEDDNVIMSVINSIDSTKEAFDTMLIHVNRVLVTEEQENFKEFFDHLENGGTFLYHCTKGKDRAGFATAMFLSALGVDRETVIDNYLKSNEYLSSVTGQTIQFVISIGLDGELLRPILEVKPEYIQTAFDIIDNEYGGVENYLRNNLGVNIEKLKELYLE